MMLKAFSIYDCKAFQYFTPFFSSTDGAATRTFSDLVNDTSSTVHRHPADYSLWFIGLYDDNTGEFSPSRPLVHIVDASTLVPIERVKELI